MNRRLKFNVREAGTCADDRPLVRRKAKVGKQDLTVTGIDVTITVDVRGRYISGAARCGAACRHEYRRIVSIHIEVAVNVTCGGEVQRVRATGCPGNTQDVQRRSIDTVYRIGNTGCGSSDNRTQAFN